MDIKIETLIKAVLKKTEEKKAIWNKTSASNKFIITLANDESITISFFSDNFGNGEYELNIFNSKGELILSETEPEGVFPILGELFKAARSSYFKVDETIDSILNNLEDSDTIGIEEKNEEDDLPF